MVASVGGLVGDERFRHFPKGSNINARVIALEEDHSILTSKDTHYDNFNFFTHE
jgi:hypothetical protein